MLDGKGGRREGGNSRTSVCRALWSHASVAASLTLNCCCHDEPQRQRTEGGFPAGSFRVPPVYTFTLVQYVCLVLPIRVRPLRSDGTFAVKVAFPRWHSRLHVDRRALKNKIKSCNEPRPLSIRLTLCIPTTDQTLHV